MTPTIEDIREEKGIAPDVGPSGKDKGKDAEETELEKEQGTEDPLNNEEVEEESLFIIKKRILTKLTMSTRQKHKANKSKGAITLSLTDGDINEIGDKVQEVTLETWDKIYNNYIMLLAYVQQGIAELRALS